MGAKWERNFRGEVAWERVPPVSTGARRGEPRRHGPPSMREPRQNETLKSSPMTRIDERVVDALRQRLGDVRRPDVVRAHEFRPETWRRWIGHCASASSVVDEFRMSDAIASSQVSRADLASLSAAVDESDTESVLRLFVATMIWGSGTSNGRGPRYTAAALDDERLLPSLVKSRHLILAGDPAGAYASFRSRGVGPAFFTKWFWAAGLDQDLDPMPLILDARVWASLAALEWSSRDAAGSNRRAKRYVAYLESMGRWVAAGLPGVATAEQLEQVMFRWAGGR